MTTTPGSSGANHAGPATRRSRAQRWFTELDLVPVSAAYDRRVSPMFAATAVEAGLSRLGRPPRRVLEVGCGRGHALGLLARRLPGCELVGADPSPTAIAAARAGVGTRQDVSLHCVAAEELTVDLVGPVDLVLAHLTIALWRDAVRGLASCLDVVAPGGLCYVLDLLRPANDEAAIPYLAPARGEEELRYLEDQMAVWYSAGELLNMVNLLCPPGSDLLPEVVFSGFDDLAVGVLGAPAARSRLPEVGEAGEGQVCHLFFRRRS